MVTDAAQLTSDDQIQNLSAARRRAMTSLGDSGIMELLDELAVFVLFHNDVITEIKTPSANVTDNFRKIKD